MAERTRAIVAADWSNMEGRLTAFFSGDATLTAELENELTGGHKVHALNAAMIYGCKPEEAKTFLVNFKGQIISAYDAAKRLGHGFNYGMGEGQMERTFWLPRAFCREIIGLMSDKYKGVVGWRGELTDRVFGVWRYACPVCGFEDNVGRTCPNKHKFPAKLRFVEVAQRGTEIEYTAFGRRRLYRGRRAEGSKALASQHPQSCGHSIWARTGLRLHGYDLYIEGPWPAPPGALKFDPEAPVGNMLLPSPVSIMTGTYDSFYVECPDDEKDKIGEWVLHTMEQSWAELGGLRLPAELSVGYNMGKRTEDNPDGLEDVKRQAFTAGNPYGTNRGTLSLLR